MPYAWHLIQQRLMVACSAQAISEDPPRPLILSGWMATDRDKHVRWADTLAWAQRYGLNDLIGDIAPEDMYRVRFLTDAPYSYLGIPRYILHGYEASPCIGKADREAALKKLTRNWGRSVSPEIAAVTYPRRITGAKGRRLVIAVLGESTPPWGTWFRLHEWDETRRRHFTNFRRAINEHVAPVEFDHIDFGPVPASGVTRWSKPRASAPL
jgi:hypothetical protein